MTTHTLTAGDLLAYLTRTQYAANTQTRGRLFIVTHNGHVWYEVEQAGEMVHSGSDADEAVDAYNDLPVWREESTR